MKTDNKLKLLGIFAALGIGLAVTGCGRTEPEVDTAADSSNVSISFTPGNFSEGVQELNNPYRGFYYMCGIGLTEDDPSEVAAYYEERIRDVTLPLVLIQFNMAKYRESELSPNVLESIDKILEITKSHGKTAILRFHYDWDNEAMLYEPRDVRIIAHHMGQFALPVNRHKDTVFLLQGLCTGNYGEMHGTNYSSPEDITYLCNTLAEVIDPDIFLSVRTPSQLRTILDTNEELTVDNAFATGLQSRLGVYDDGMLGSALDLGTFDDSPRDTSIPGDMGTREEETDYMDNLALFTPLGGEAVTMEGQDSSYSDFETALPQLQKIHVSYLNSAHDMNVINKWNESVYYGDGPFDGFSGYEYIAAHMGYRYYLSQSDITLNEDSDNITLSATIQNLGFASCYRDFTLEIAFYDTEDQSTEPVYRDEISDRIKFLHGGSEESYSFLIPLSELEAKTYKVSARLTDPITGQNISFANNYNNLDESGNIILGTFELKDR